MTGIKFKQKYPFGLRTVSIKRRLMIVVVVVILLLVFAFHIMFSTIVSSYMSYVELSNTRLVNSMSEAFASGINSLVAVTKYPVIRVSSLPTKTYEYLSYPNYYKANVLYSDLEYHSAFLFDQNRSIRLISIFDMFGNGSYVKHDRKQTYILAPNHREYKSEDLIKATWFEKTLEKKGRHRVWRYEDLSLPRIYLPDATEMIFVSRAIMSTEKFEPIGVALAGVDIGDLEPLFESSKILPRQIMSLYDTSGRQLWGEGSPEGGEAFLSWLKAQPEIGDVGNFIATVENHKKIYNYSRVVDDIYCVLETPYEDVLTTVLRSKFNVLCAIFIVGALITMAINFIVRSITLPIKGLIASCDDVKRGNFSVAVYDPFKDELSALSDSFNSMTREIEYLISDVYEKQMELTHTELQLLRSQINPHFLYNTLETIRIKAFLSQQDELSDMAFLLATILRYGISSPAETVSVSTEITHLNDYIKLQSMLYSNSFVADVNIEPEMMDCKMLKFLLQPLVENALYHGISSISTVGTVAILGFRQEDNLVFQIIDNGNGMPSDVVTDLRGFLDNKNQHFTSIGLKNVHRRIQLTYGEKYGVVIQSELGRGTMISITIPNQ